jgi:hypothetical protein
MAMTRHYLIGELSAVCGELQEEVTSPASAPDVARLRREVEAAPPAELGPVATRALELIDRLCRESLDHGDATAFTRLADIGAELRVFGVCAGLLTDTPRYERSRN